MCCTIVADTVSVYFPDREGAARSTMSTREAPEAREEEILNACEKLYAAMNFRDITIKEISAETSCSRSSIYNYFQTKEEVFLRLFEREYLLWCEVLEQIAAEDVKPGELPEQIARSLEKRELMLKLLAALNDI